MNVLLINPPYIKGYSRASRSAAVTKSGTLYYPIFLGYLAAFLEKNNFKIKLIDAIADDLDIDKIFNIICEFQPSAVICDASPPSGKCDAQFLDALKTKFPKIKCVLVGQYPTFYSNELLNADYSFDAFIIKEYDDAVLKYLTVSQPNLNNLFIKAGGKFLQSGYSQPNTVELDEFPFVSKIFFKNLDIKKYFYSAVNYPVITILASRGCPYKCSFCALPSYFYLKYRQRSIENLIQEFEFIKSTMPYIKTVFLEDDSFNANLDYLKEFCKAKIKFNNQLEWAINFSPANYDEESIALLKQANCKLLVIGYETANNNILKKIGKKNTSVEKYFELTNLIKKYKINIHGCFIFGLPSETEQDAKNTIKTAIKLNPDTVQFFPMMINPHTDLFYYYKYNNYLLTEQSDYNTIDGLHHTNVSTNELPADKIMALCAAARKRFYFRFSYIFRRFLKSFGSMYEFKRFIRVIRAALRTIR